MAEIITELSEIIALEARKLPVDEIIADNFTSCLIDRLKCHFGGATFYFPKKDLTERNNQIYERFNGKNHAELCREFDLSYQQVLRIISQFSNKC